MTLSNAQLYFSLNYTCVQHHLKAESCFETMMINTEREFGAHAWAFMPNTILSTATYSSQCEQQSVLPFQAFTGERPPKQHKITALLHQKKVQEIAPGSARTRIMRSSMKLPESKTWANCSPSTGYATCIPHHHFKVWLQYYCQVPLFQPGARCKTPQCAAVMDTYGDHLLYCERGPIQFGDMMHR